MSVLPVVVKAQPVYSGAGSKAPFYWFTDIDRERLGWEAREKVLIQLKEEAEKENVVLKQKIKEVWSDAREANDLLDRYIREGKVDYFNPDLKTKIEEPQEYLRKIEKELLGLSK